MRSLYLVRHGDTDATWERRYEGRGNSELNWIGLLQAESAAESIILDACRAAQSGTSTACADSRGIAAVYSSPSRRALDTARLIGGRVGLVPVIMQGLAEVDFGDWEGLTYDEILRRSPDLLERWVSDPLGTWPPGGESLLDVWRRTRSCLEKIISLHRSSSGTCPRDARGGVVLVSHGGPLRAILSFHERGDLSAFSSASIVPGEVKAISMGSLAESLSRG